MVWVGWEVVECSMSHRNLQQGVRNDQGAFRIKVGFALFFVAFFEFLNFPRSCALACVLNLLYIAMLSVTSAHDKENSLFTSGSNGKTFGGNNKPAARKALGEITNTPARKALGEITNKQPTNALGPQKTFQKERMRFIYIFIYPFGCFVYHMSISYPKSISSYFLFFLDTILIHYTGCHCTKHRSEGEESCQTQDQGTYSA